MVQTLFFKSDIPSPLKYLGIAVENQVTIYMCFIHGFSFLVH